MGKRRPFYFTWGLKSRGFVRDRVYLFNLTEAEARAYEAQNPVLWCAVMVSIDDYCPKHRGKIGRYGDDHSGA
jgi:hypothetical protein